MTPHRGRHMRVIADGAAMAQAGCPHSVIGRDRQAGWWHRNACQNARAWRHPAGQM